MERPSVVVVGAGIAGLTAAWEISGGRDGPSDATPRVEVIDAAARVGGSLATAEFAGRTIDLGADGFLGRRREALTLVDELGLHDRLEAIGARGASLWLRGALHELPDGLVLGVPTNLRALTRFQGVSWRAHWAARRDTYFPRRVTVGDDVTIGDLTRAKLGAELSYSLIEPIIGGVQAGRIDELSAQSVFPALWEAARGGGSLMKALRAVAATSSEAPGNTTAPAPLFFTLVDGVGSLPAELERRLIERDVVVRRGVAVTALRRTPAGGYPWEVDTRTTTTPANAVVLATPANVAGELLGAVDGALAQLREVRSADAAIITLSLSRRSLVLPERGTGVLIPLNSTWTGSSRDGAGPMMVTGVTFLDRKWPHLVRENDVVLRAHVGRSDDGRWAEMDDETLTRRVTAEVASVLPQWGEVYESRVQRWPLGLPQYTVGHAQRVERARAAAAAYSVALAGNAYDGVGVPASIGSGQRAGRETLSALGPRRDGPSNQ